MGLLHGRAGRLTAANGGFRPGQMATRCMTRALYFCSGFAEQSEFVHYGAAGGEGERR
jgi:hypothetical protein